MGYTALMAVGLGMAVGGKYSAGQAASAEAKGQQRMAQYNAGVMRKDAEAARQKGQFDQLRSLHGLAIEDRKILQAVEAEIGPLQIY